MDITITAITLTNNFHDTRLEVKLPAGETTIPRRRVAAWRERLCGSPACTCSGIVGDRPAVLDASDNHDETVTVRVTAGNLRG